MRRLMEIIILAAITAASCGDSTDRRSDGAIDGGIELGAPDAADGASCAAPLTACDSARGPVCIDLSDPRYCGSCERYFACEGDFCEMTHCCSTDCTIGAGCVDVFTDELNCGGCGIECTDGEYCVEGECMGRRDAG